MRIRIRHEIVRRFEPAARDTITVLRASPRNHESQHVFGWRIDVDKSCQLAQSEDAFGNLTQVFTLEGPTEEIGVLIEGEVETQDTAGVIRGTIERLPPPLFLRSTSETELSGAVVALATEVAALESDPLSRLHRLLAAVHERIALDPDPSLPCDAAATLERGSGTDSGLAHVFIAATRKLGQPARFVAGYVLPADGSPERSRPSAWAEAHVAGLGWIAFDPVAKRCATEAYVRIASALDRLGAEPMRSAFRGFGEVRVSGTVSVKEDRRFGGS